MRTKFKSNQQIKSVKRRKGKGTEAHNLTAVEK